MAPENPSAATSHSPNALAQVEEEIARACREAGRDRASVTLIAVSKTFQADAIAPVIVALPDEISVEGHANVLPVSGRYPTNWELSADRATQVLRHFVEADGLAANRVEAVGFGDARPMATGSDADSLAVNRRVDVVVVSGASDQVRALVPGIVNADQGK